MFTLLKNSQRCRLGTGYRCRFPSWHQLVGTYVNLIVAGFRTGTYIDYRYRVIVSNQHL
jgi:hypothetical protein